MKNLQNQPQLSPELERELSYFLRVRNRYTRIALGFWKLVFLWIAFLGGLAVFAEIFGLLSRRFH
jgi:hypothetical protein